MEKVVKLFSVSKAVSELKINEGYFPIYYFSALRNLPSQNLFFIKGNFTGPCMIHQIKP
jgi:hypothetical protein